MFNTSMNVIKRDGRREEVSFDKVLRRIQASGRGLEVNPALIAQKVLARIYDGVRTSELDELAAHLASAAATVQPDYGTLAARIAISNHQANTRGVFSEVMYELAHQVHPKTGKPVRYISEELEAFIDTNKDAINARVDYERDFLFDYFGFKTLERAYLLKDSSGKILERPQDMWMRVALGIWGNDLEEAFRTYDLMSQKYFTHATPTLFNAGTPNPQLSSCYLLAMDEDSIAGIYKTLSDCAKISKHAGGIGLHIHNVRAKGSLIHGTNGSSNGIVPMLRVFNSTARYVDQGGGRRNGSFAIYLEPWHDDVEDFLRLKLNTGTEEERARDLFYGMWMPDLFMERVEAGADWTLFCPAEAPGLADVWGDEFKALYERYETEGRGRRKVPAQQLWFQILSAQIETGTPYLVYKDAANRKSNQQNLGTIKSSNLCSEIIEYSDKDETAVCNLASIALPAYVDTKKRQFDFERLRGVVKQIVRNLDRVIDINYYPTPETRRSNMRHRPIGIGVQGLADVFAILRMPWEDARAAELNQRIFEHIYYAAVETSVELAVEKGSYETFSGSPASMGHLQFDLWGITPKSEMDGTLDWNALKLRVMREGLRNSLLVAPMPTASTSQILGYNECITGDTPVNIQGGISIPMKHLVHNKLPVLSYNTEVNGLIQSEQLEFIPRGEKNIVKVTLQDGRTLRCTPDHKVLTNKHEWKEVSKLDISSDRIIASTSSPLDIPDDDEIGWELNTDIGKLTVNNTFTERVKALAFARLVGYICSDGSISAGGKVAAVFGTEYDREQFVQDAKLLTEDSTTIKMRKTVSNCYEVILTGALGTAIRNLEGIPHGTCVSQIRTCPTFITDIKCPKSIVREWLGGFFGGDGIAPSLARQTQNVEPTFTAIKLSLSTCPNYEISLREMMEQIVILLAKCGVDGGKIVSRRISRPSLDVEAYRCGDTEHIVLTLALRQSAFEAYKFGRYIGFRYCIHKSTRLSAASSWFDLMERIEAQRNRFITDVLNRRASDKLGQGKGSVKRAYDATVKKFKENEVVLNQWYSVPKIEHIYDAIKRERTNIANPRMNHVITPINYLKEIGADKWFNMPPVKGSDPLEHPEYSDVIYATDINVDSSPCFSLSVIDIRSDGTDTVYDINVKDTHNFVANGLVVHNCIEPFTSNIYTRRTLAGEFIIVNKYLMRDLITFDLWNEGMKQKIIAHNGSVQDIAEIPDALKRLYKTAWEIKQRTLIDMAADRGAFVCQSQSLNLFMADPNFSKLTSMHFHAWKRGLKTGIYYLRTKAPAAAQKFTVDPELLTAIEADKVKRRAEELAAAEGCLHCSS